MVIDMDSAIICGVSFVASYFLLNYTRLPLIILLVFAVGIAWLAMKAYDKVKEDTTRGFIWHWMYEKSIWKTKEDPEVFPELKRLDITNVIPDAFENEFND